MYTAQVQKCNVSIWITEFLDFEIQIAIHHRQNPLESEYVKH
jgi:hypothetical protein